MVSALIAMAIFLSTTGLSIDMHFCQDHLKSISFFGDAKSCVEKMANCQKHDTDKLVNETKKRCPIGCCTDEMIQLDSIEELFIQATEKNVDEVPIGLFFIQMTLIAVCVDQKFTPIPDIYKPPKIIKCIFKLVYSFLL